VFDALQQLLSWLQVPWKHELRHELRDPESVTYKMSAEFWTCTGQCRLVKLMAAADWGGELAGVAALLQAILLAMAGELLFCGP
jgi:hypothetical protein